MILIPFSYFVEEKIHILPVTAMSTNSWSNLFFKQKLGLERDYG